MKLLPETDSSETFFVFQLALINITDNNTIITIPNRNVDQTNEPAEAESDEEPNEQTIQMNDQIDREIRQLREHLAQTQGAIPKSTSGTTNTKKSGRSKRMDPAVKQALTSKDSFFKDIDIDSLNAQYNKITEDMEKLQTQIDGQDIDNDIQQISSDLNKEYDKIDTDIESILSEQEEN